jgi:hypothetical protein
VLLIKIRFETYDACLADYFMLQYRI